MPIFLVLKIRKKQNQNPANENGLKWIEIFSIRMRILNSKYFFLDLIEFNWIQLGAIELKNCISYSKFWIEQYSQCTEKANIIFRLKGIEICSMQFLQMNNARLKRIHFKHS